MKPTLILSGALIFIYIILMPIISRLILGINIQIVVLVWDFIFGLAFYAYGYIFSIRTPFATFICGIIWPFTIFSVVWLFTVNYLRDNFNIYLLALLALSLCIVVPLEILEKHFPTLPLYSQFWNIIY
jgi:hypothetical protein